MVDGLCEDTEECYANAEQKCDKRERFCATITHFGNDAAHHWFKSKW